MESSVGLVGVVHPRLLVRPSVEEHPHKKVKPRSNLQEGKAHTPQPERMDSFSIYKKHCRAVRLREYVRCSRPVHGNTIYGPR